ncbi:hypothetical protein [Mycoplasmopsis caviae]|uniref:Uncharacterized protein n=1 Tax=Mycoplasmopsis caviae TaxID=55603 RepID=A0A3P8L873_9BACT|nr:hypothetical protein [Mycoplasmopsis caviae]VDR42605.1 Uncharacterised protein [Mycoplasmopsis caviae]
MINKLNQISQPRERERESKNEFNWLVHNERDCQKAFWNYVIKGIYIDESNEILDHPYYEEKLLYQTDGIHNGVLFEFKKNLTNQTVYRAFGESLSYLRKFNNDGLKKIPRWICIATFDSKKYWLIDANNFKEFIYDQKYEDLYNIPSNSPHTFTLEPAGIWLDPDDLLEKVKPREGEEKYLKTRLNLHNFLK